MKFSQPNPSAIHTLNSPHLHWFFENQRSLFNRFLFTSQSRYWVPIQSFNIWTVKSISSRYRTTREFPEMNEQTSRPVYHSTDHTTLTFHFPHYLSTHLRDEHSKIWTKHFHSHISRLSAYSRIQPTLPTKPWFTDFSHLSWKSIVAICRLRFNHHYLPANLARFIPNISRHCPSIRILSL